MEVWGRVLRCKVVARLQIGPHWIIPLHASKDLVIQKCYLWSLLDSIALTNISIAGSNDFF
jgi:hypothetical protein